MRCALTARLAYRPTIHIAARRALADQAGSAPTRRARA